MARANGHTILDEHVDPNYAPTQSEIEEYATWLGMDLDNDKELLWIAEKGLKAALPKAWRPCQTEDNDIFYFNFETGESVWDHPCDELMRKIYHKEKKKVQPCVIGTLSASVQDSGAVAITLTSMGGNELAMLEVDNMQETLQWLQRKLKREVKQPLKIILPDGTLLVKGNKKLKLKDLLGVDAELSAEQHAVEDTPTAEDTLTEKRLGNFSTGGALWKPSDLPSLKIPSKIRSLGATIDYWKDTDRNSSVESSNASSRLSAPAELPPLLFKKELPKMEHTGQSIVHGAMD